MSTTAEAEVRAELREVARNVLAAPGGVDQARLVILCQRAQELDVVRAGKIEGPHQQEACVGCFGGLVQVKRRVPPVTIRIVVLPRLLDGGFEPDVHVP